MERTGDARTRRAVVLVGPTAVGKSALALELARALGGAILAADSRQVYRYMDIGTAKPTPADRAAADHFLIDLVEPGDTYSAQRYRAEGSRVLEREWSLGRTPIVVGGTGFYLRALLDGEVWAGVPPNEQLREALRHEADRTGPEPLHARLAASDPASAARIHPRNLPRLIRALEVVQALGGPVPPVQHLPPVPALWIGLHRERDALRDIAHRRIDAQLAAGLVEETSALLAMGYDPLCPALQGFGYRQIIEYLHGRCSLDASIEAYRLATRAYIRRQMTWFRADSRITWIDAAVGLDPALQLVRAGEFSELQT